MNNDVFSALSQKQSTKSTAVSKMTELFGIKVNACSAVLPIGKLKEKSNHPFQVSDDEKMEALAESIRCNGLIQPIIVRKIENGYYEILAGHRRTMACRKIKENNIKAIIVEADEEIANRIMIDTNFQQRENHLPSEIAKAYKIRHDDLKKRQYCQIENSNGWNSEEKIDKLMEIEFSTSKSKIYMYLRLEYLYQDLINALDEKRLKLRIAVELSYLTEQEQKIVYEMVYDKALFKISLKKAVQLKKKSKADGITKDDIWNILAGELLDEKTVLYFSDKDISRYKTKFHSTEDMKKAIIQFLENY